MTDTTYDEARRCPRCKELGKEIKREPVRHGAILHTIKCLNERCRWYDTTYVVQVNADGTIPPPDEHRIKLFPSLPERSDESVERQFNAILGQQLSGGGEVGR